jgi:Leucine Rich Repeat (LRR) protein
MMDKKDVASLSFSMIITFLIANETYGMERLMHESACFLSFPSSEIALVETEAPPDSVKSTFIQFDDNVDRENFDDYLELLLNISYLLDFSCRKNLTHEHLRKITQIPSVKALALAETYLDNAGLKIISTMSLQYLNVNENHFDDDGMPTIGLFSQLVELKIAFNKITQVGILSLGSLKNLKILDAHGTYLYDDGIKSLSMACNQLEVLNVRACGFSDVALDYFLTMPNLLVLHISDNGKLTLAGVEKFLSEKRSNLFVR